MASQVVVSGDSSSSQWVQTCVEKWLQTKSELKSEMENWRDEWRTLAAEWIDKIKIEVGKHWLPLTPVIISFPSENLSKYQNFKIKIIPTAPTWKQEVKVAATIVVFGDENGITSVTTGVIVATIFANHHRSVFQGPDNSLPINLFGDLVFHIVRAFGGWFDYFHPTENAPTKASVYTNYLCLDKQHLFPSFETKVCDPFDLLDRWMRVEHKAIISGGELAKSEYYRQELFDKLCAHQTMRLIDSHFAKCKSNQLTQKLLECAHRFSTSLKIEGAISPGNTNLSHFDIYSRFFTIRLSCETLSEALSFSFCDQTDKEKQLCQLQLSSKRCRFVSTASLSSAEAVEIIGDLTSSDLDSIIRIVLEVYYCRLQLDKAIDPRNLSKLSNEFPSADDHFESFDEPAMRGLLTETSAARKLVAHETQLKLLRQNVSESTHPVPIAVADLMESYLTPLL